MTIDNRLLYVDEMRKINTRVFREFYMNGSFNNDQVIIGGPYHGSTIEQAELLPRPEYPGNRKQRRAAAARKRHART